MIQQLVVAIGVWLVLALAFVLLANAAYRRFVSRGLWMIVFGSTVALTIIGTRNIHSAGLHNDVVPGAPQPHELIRDAIGPLIAASASCVLSALALRRRQIGHGTSRRSVVLAMLAFLAGPLLVLLVIAIVDIGPVLLP